jgi:Zn-dependent peptidase ImmA (M78 family)
VFDRGFKTWCEKVASSFRSDLGVGPHDPLDPRKLAAHLRVLVWRIEEIPGIPPECVRTLLADAESWSAATVAEGNRHAIILNSGHSLPRQNSDLMHELSHLIRAHTPARMDISSDGLLLLSTYDKKQEDEANWLAGCLLLPRATLIRSLQLRLSVAGIATKYGASEEMTKYRINVTGVEYQLVRTSRKNA